MLQINGLSISCPLSDAAYQRTSSHRAFLNAYCLKVTRTFEQNDTSRIFPFYVNRPPNASLIIFGQYAHWGDFTPIEASVHGCHWRFFSRLWGWAVMDPG